VFPSDYLTEGLITDADISSWLAALPQHTTFACFIGYLGNVCLQLQPPAAFKGFMCSAFEDVDPSRAGCCGLISGEAIELLSGGDTDTAVFQAGLYRQLRRRRCCPTPLVVCTQSSVLHAWPLVSPSSIEPPPLLSYSSLSPSQDAAAARAASLTPHEVSLVKQLLAPNAAIATSLVVMSQHFSRDLAEDVVVPIVALLSVNGRASSVTRMLTASLMSSASDLHSCLGKGSVLARFLSLYIRMHCRGFVAHCLLPIIQMCSQLPSSDPSSIVTALGRILLERVYDFPSDVRGVLSSIPELCTRRGWESPHLLLADILVSRVLAAALRVPVAAGLLPSAPDPQLAERLELVAFSLRKFVGRLAGSDSSSNAAASVVSWRGFLDAVTCSPGPIPPPSSSTFTFGLSDQVQVSISAGASSHARAMHVQLYATCCMSCRQPEWQTLFSLQPPPPPLPFSCQPLMRACSSHLPLLASIFAQVTSPLSPTEAAGVSSLLFPPHSPSSIPAYLTTAASRSFLLSDMALLHPCFGQCPGSLSRCSGAHCPSHATAHPAAAGGFG
jgi:hypothetical protein